MHLACQAVKLLSWYALPFLALCASLLVPKSLGHAACHVYVVAVISLHFFTTHVLSGLA